MSADSKDQPISHLLLETRVFSPPSDFQNSAHISSVQEYQRLWLQSIESPQTFWAEMAQKHLHWMQPFSEVLRIEDDFHHRWFHDGKLNVSYNCLDRHLPLLRDKTALIWEGEPEGERRTYTYGELHAEVCDFAQVLREHGITKQDVVTIYMPMLPELAIAMLACARIGAMHNIVFAGFSHESLAERNNNCQAKLIITADFGYRKGKKLMLKEIVDQSLSLSPSVKQVIVIPRDTAGRGARGEMTGRGARGEGTAPRTEKQGTAPRTEVEALDAEHPLFLLYTSGSTGKPKGVMHSSAGYLLNATLTAHYIFDLKPDDIFWCTADIGWVTGHNYVIYGLLSQGATTLMYEGAPQSPDWGRMWRIIERHRVTKFYTAPTAIRAFMKQGREWPDRYDLSSLKLLGSVGEPINPEAWMWYHEVIGRKRCPIVDTWWQTETGSIMISTLPGAHATKPGSAGMPFFGVQPEIVDEQGELIHDDNGGYLVIKKPWPSMARTIYGDHSRFVKQYFSQFHQGYSKGSYFTGDGARRDSDGYFWIMGRIDDVINVSGHRLSTMEIESALVSHPRVAEAAVVTKKDELKGESIVCFVLLRQSGETKSETLETELIHYVADKIGALARPEKIYIMDTLPKTRSGKIMRRVLRNIANGQSLSGDLSTLEDSSFMEQVQP